ncbi:MAG: hypothetical protein ACK4ZJ_19740, partial [Allorhizobium sp.]
MERRGAEQDMFRELLYSILVAVADADLQQYAMPLLHGLCRHFALLVLSHSRWASEEAEAKAMSAEVAATTPAAEA